MNPYRLNRARQAALFAAVAVVTVGCATREVPRGHPDGSPLAVAKAAPVTEVASALSGDPPLPGEDLDLWPGLAPPLTVGAAGLEAAIDHADHDPDQSPLGGGHVH